MRVPIANGYIRGKWNERKLQIGCVFFWLEKFVTIAGANRFLSPEVYLENDC